MRLIFLWLEEVRPAFAAALAAVREGRSVFLAEGQACLGGMGTAGMVPAFMTFDDGINFLADGIGREVLENLTREKEPQHPTNSGAIPAEISDMPSESMPPMNDP